MGMIHKPSSSIEELSVPLYAPDITNEACVRSTCAASVFEFRVAVIFFSSLILLTLSNCFFKFSSPSNWFVLTFAAAKI